MIRFLLDLTPCELCFILYDVMVCSCFISQKILPESWQLEHSEIISRNFYLMLFEIFNNSYFRQCCDNVSIQFNIGFQTSLFSAVLFRSLSHDPSSVGVHGGCVLSDIPRIRKHWEESECSHFILFFLLI